MRGWEGRSHVSLPPSQLCWARRPAEVAVGGVLAAQCQDRIRAGGLPTSPHSVNRLKSELFRPAAVQTLKARLSLPPHKKSINI